MLIEILLITGLGLLLIKSDQECLRESQARKFVGNMANLMVLTHEAPYYLIASIHFQNDNLFRQYEKDIQQIKELQKQSLETHFDDPESLRLASKMMADENVLMDMLESMVKSRRRGESLKLLTNISNLQSQFDSQRDRLIKQMTAASLLGTKFTLRSEKLLLEVQQLQDAIIILGIAANVITGTLLLIYYRRSIAKRLERVANNTKLLSQGESLLPPLSGSDEIKLLDQAFHFMDKELRESSARERDLFNNASDVICVLDAEGKFTKINPACFKRWHYQPSNLLNRKMTDIILEEDVPLTTEAINTAKTTKVPFEFENRLKTDKNETLEVLWSTYWSESEASLFCVVHDISERKNIERIKKQFLTVITFDLKAPLSSIAASINLLTDKSKEKFTKEAHEKLEMANRNVQRLLGLVNDLLQISQLDSGSLELQKQRCSVPELLKRAIQDVEALAQNKQITVELNSATAEWYVDADRMMQVLVNLLSNAIKFSPAKSTIRVSASAQDDCINVAVADEGRGVPEAYKETIFEKYKQVQSADSKRKSGTGLGLPICKQIIEEHGGIIGVESAEDKGSRFWFKIPLETKRLSKADVSPAKKYERAITQVPTVDRALAGERTKKSRGSRLRLMHKGIILIGIPILFELIFVSSMSILLLQTHAERKEELHERMIAFRSTQLFSQLLHLGIIMNSDYSEKAWRQFQQEGRTLSQLEQSLKDLVRGETEKSENFIKIEGYFQQIQNFLDRAELIMGDGPYTLDKLAHAWSRKHLLLPTSVGLVHRLHKLLNEAQKKEFVSPIKQQALREKQAQLLVAGLIMNLLISVALASFFSKDITSRLKILADNADRLAKDKPLNKQLEGSDEIAELDQVFHRTAKTITEARQKERAVFDNSQDLICVLDKNGKFKSTNPACRRLFQYEQEELLQKTLWEIVLPQDKENTSKVLSDNYSETKQKTIENRIVRKDGSVTHILWSFSKAHDQDDIFCIAHDINSRKELEELKQEFLAMVSHDLRTPLTAITGVTTLMSAGVFGKLQEPTKEVLSGISLNAGQLLELVNDLLDIEKLEAGQMQLLLESIAVQDLVEESIASYRNVVQFEAGTASVKVLADKDRMIQAISNILHHIIKRNPQEHPIKISFNNNQEWVEIQLHDRAPVISIKAREELFNRFKNISNLDDKVEDGTGLALPIARKIIESHGGQVGIESSDNVGNTIWIRLPVSLNTKAS